MTQTLRRELIQKFLDIMDNDCLFGSFWTDKPEMERLKPLAEKLADAAMQLRGFSMLKDKPLDPGFLMAAGASSEEVYSAVHSGDAVEEALVKFDVGLKCNLPRTGVWQDFAKWAMKQTGPALEEWIAWYKLDKFRSDNGWRMTPEKIKISWPQAKSDTTPNLYPKWVPEEGNWVPAPPRKEEK